MCQVHEGLFKPSVSDNFFLNFPTGWPHPTNQKATNARFTSPSILEVFLREQKCIVKIYQSEIQSLKTRALASTLAPASALHTTFRHNQRPMSMPAPNTRMGPAHLGVNIGIRTDTHADVRMGLRKFELCADVRRERTPERDLNANLLL